MVHTGAVCEGAQAVTKLIRKLNLFRAEISGATKATSRIHLKMEPCQDGRHRKRESFWMDAVFFFFVVVDIVDEPTVPGQSPSSQFCKEDTVVVML